MAWNREAHQGHAIRQLQNVWQATAAGAAADTNITVTGAKIGDEVKAVEYTAGVPGVVIASVTAVNVVQVTTATTGNTVLFTIYPKQ
ncbi:MAG: hypothetical protein BMS9Abin11_1011 [Gammaproteobacteria bacterium]|nr:MAG: hypothetical protein BMS9Abin11_1011 [Gammaproteobacteria bacterium]